MRRPRFSRSPDPYQVAFDLEQGRIFVTTQPPGERSVAVTLNTPQAEILFSNGSYDVMIDGDKTQVRAPTGEATVIGAGQQVNVSSGERTEIAAGQAPAAPVSAALDMVLNGSFEGRVSRRRGSRSPRCSPGLPAGEMSVAEDGQRNAVRFYRSAEDGAPNRVGICKW